MNDPNRAAHRPEAEQRLLQALEDRQATLNAIQDPICLLDREGTVLQCNEGMSRFLDLPNEKIVGLKCYALMHGSRTFLGECPYRRMLRSGKRESLEMAVGDRCYMVSADPIFAESGAVCGAVHMLRDITELKRAEQSVRTLARRLLTAQEVERRRLAREMHDDLTQRLAVLAIEAGKLEQALDSAGTAPARLREMKEQLIRLSKDVHALSRQLHPSILDDLGLVDALRSECASFSQREGIAVRCALADVPSQVPKDVALCLYRIVQEGLRNVAKHSGARQAAVSLAATDEGILLSIEDPGAGFDPAQVPGKPSLGLASMEERARLVGGDFSIRSGPGRGTLIEVWTPLSEGKP